MGRITVSCKVPTQPTLCPDSEYYTVLIATEASASIRTRIAHLQPLSAIRDCL
jgi:hypothetical protein